MFKFFVEDKECKIIFTPPIVKTDLKQLRTELNEEYEIWVIEFGSIYSIDADLILLLEHEIFYNKKNIKIITHRNSLSRYLQRLGFKTIFSSWIKDNIATCRDIELVVIGGSASSSIVIKNIVEHIEFSHLSLVIIQHSIQDSKAIFDRVLKSKTEHNICYIEDNMSIEKGVIYISPSNRHLKVSNSKFILDDGEKFNGSKPSISICYNSLSDEYRERAIFIQSCGYLKDGIDALENLVKNGSTIIIQEPKECIATDMPEDAISLNLHHYKLDYKSIVSYINFVDKSLSKEEWIIYLLEIIYERYNYDFRLYNLNVFIRRVEVFMIKHDIDNLKDTVGTILFSKASFKSLFLDISINVTEFFREPETIDSVVSFIEEKYKHTSHIKIWSAGCSSGEEIYSLAILLDNLEMLEKSIIYATDFNQVIIQNAKNGIYTSEMYEVGKNNFAKIHLEDKFDNYLVKNDRFLRICDKIRSKVNFFVHNLVTDGSFNEFDIIVCRNVIIYFNDALQKRVFELFYNSLRFGGYLVLGESETICKSHRDKFQPLSSESKIFIKVN